jgi:RimJ/RimL family protein N-acetyltransferase
MLSDIEIRPPAAEDTGALRAFFARLPERDRTFFREDVLDDTVLQRWSRNPPGRRLLAVGADAAVWGALAIEPETGWSSHVGELRVVIDAAHRRQGLGRAMSRRGLLEALDMGLTKIVVRALAMQTGTIALFSDIGFRGEALLRDHVRDRDGNHHDLIVLAHAVDDELARLTTTGVVEELG